VVLRLTAVVIQGGTADFLKPFRDFVVV